MKVGLSQGGTTMSSIVDVMCDGCGNDFKKKQCLLTKHNFCCRACGGSFNTKLFLHKCLTCGVETMNPKFCSTSCAGTHNGHLRAKSNPCLYCGEQCHQLVRKFCSHKCSRL